MAHKYPTATAGKIVSVHYVGTFDGGSEFDNSYNRGKPITFELGANQMLLGFEQACIGLTAGEKKSVRLTPETAYGEIHEHLFKTFTVSDFPEDFDLIVGEMISVPTESGKIFPATVYSKDDHDVVLNFNHPMAGKNLNFDIEIVGIEMNTKNLGENIGETNQNDNEAG